MNSTVPVNQVRPTGTTTLATDSIPASVVLTAGAMVNGNGIDLRTVLSQAGILSSAPITTPRRLTSLVGTGINSPVVSPVTPSVLSSTVQLKPVCNCLTTLVHGPPSG